MLCVLVRVASTYHYFIEDGKDIPKLSPFASWPGIMINPQWLELLSKTKFHSPKDVLPIAIQLYIHIFQNNPGLFRLFTYHFLRK